MAGNKIGGIKARDKNLASDPLFYQKLGKRGGSVSTPFGGFGADHERARIAGAKGGSIPRRKPKCTTI